MAANDPGLAPLNAPAEDPVKGAIDIPGADTPVAPDQFDEKYETTKKEIWAYYAYVAAGSAVIFGEHPSSVAMV
jgi:hypothetical protein